MPSVFNSPYYDDIDWNPSTGATSNRDLPYGDNSNNRRRRRDVSRGSQGARNAWGLEDNMNDGAAWGAPEGTSDGPAMDSHQPFRDPFSGSHRTAQRQPPIHSSRSLSNSRGERHMNQIGNMNGHNTYDHHPRRNNAYDGNDDEDIEDEPFFPEDELGTPRPHPQSHTASTHSQYPPYMYPYPYGMYPPYPPPPQMPYGYPPTIPPHSNPVGNAAFFHTGRDERPPKKIIHRRRSEDDLEFAARTGNGNRNGWVNSGDTNGWDGYNNGRARGNSNDDEAWGGSNNNDNWGGPNNNDNWGGPRNNDNWGGPNNNNDNWGNPSNNDNWGNPSNNDGWSSQNGHNDQERRSWKDSNRVNGSFHPQKAYDHQRRHVSSPAWGNTPADHNDDEGDLEPGEIRINSDGNVSQGGWNSFSREQHRNNNNWGTTADDNLESPGSEVLARELANLRFDQPRNHSHRQYNSSIPDLVDQEQGGGTPRRDPVWGSDETITPSTQPYPNERPIYTRDSDRTRRLNHRGTHPFTANDQSLGSSYATRNAYENNRRQAYADAFEAGGSGDNIGNGVASQLKEKAMKWLRGGGISSITLHPILRTPAMLRPNLLAWDVRRKPNPARAGMPIGEAMSAFLEPASKPPLQHMHLVVPIPDLQGTYWHIDVYPNMEDQRGKKQFTFEGSPTSFGRSQRKKRSLSMPYNSAVDYDENPTYTYDDYAIIRCGDVLFALTRMLNMSATSHDYHALSKPRQKQVYNAFASRCHEIEDPSSGHIFTAHKDETQNAPEVNEKVIRKHNRGLKRVDLLCGRTRWEGLEPNGVDSWMVKLGKTMIG